MFIPMKGHLQTTTRVVVIVLGAHFETKLFFFFKKIFYTQEGISPHLLLPLLGARCALETTIF